MASLWRSGLACAVLAGACGSPWAGGEDQDAGPHAPASPASSVAPVDEAGAGDGNVGSSPDASADSSSDASETELDASGEADAEACPSPTCFGDHLEERVVWGAQCYTTKSTYCPFGCGLVGLAPACLPVDPEGPCAPGVPELDAGACAFSAKTLCFETFEAACLCMGCTATSCTTINKKAGRLKLPKLPKGGSDAAPDSAQASDSGDSAPPDAPADGPGGDAASVKLGVACK